MPKIRKRPSARKATKFLAIRKGQLSKLRAAGTTPKKRPTTSRLKKR